MVRQSRGVAALSGLAAAAILTACAGGAIAQPAPAPAAQSQQAPQAPQPPVRTITQVRGALYKVSSGAGVQPVTVFLVTSDGIILADPLNPEFAAWLKTELATRFPGKPVRYVLYSHYHWDHARGGAAFADTAKFVAHQDMAKMLASPLKVAPPPGDSFDRNGDNRLDRSEATGGTRAQFDRLDANHDGFLTPEEINADIRPPDSLFSGARHTVKLGDGSVVLVHTRRHTDDMVDMLFPKQRVLFVGDYVWPKRVCCVGGDFNQRPLSRWIASLKELEKLDFDITVNSHWDQGTKADLIATREFWEALSAEVQAGIRAGKSLQELQQSVRLERYKDWAGYDQQMPAVVLAAYNNLTQFPGP